MVSNEALVNGLRSLGYSYKDRSDRMEMYKQRGSVRRVMVRRHRNHTEQYAAEVLRQAGMPPEDIEAFLKETRVTAH